MTRLATVLLTAGVLLFIAVLVSQGLPGVMTALAAAGWGLLLVALFHLLPLLLDAAAIRALCRPAGRIGDAVLARWAGESVGGLMPAGVIGGPVLMARLLVRRGHAVASACAAVTVSTTLQAIGQILFALLGLAVLGAGFHYLSQHALRTTALVGSLVLGAQVAGFYCMQRSGLFSRVMRLVAALGGRRNWGGFLSHALAIDEAVELTYRRAGPVAASFALNFTGWVAGTGEVFLILHLIGHPVGWGAALVLESLGQAVRGAAFAVPGALGVQESGYLLLAPLVGLPAETGLVLSLAKRTRELLLGLPGLMYLHVTESGSAAVREASS